MFHTSTIPSHSRTSSADESAIDPFQWQKFDSLFDQVFGAPKPSVPDPSSERAIARRLASGGTFGPLARARAITGAEETGPTDEDFDKLWNDTLRRTKKTTTTTTKRRIIRHTPAMDMAVPDSSHTEVGPFDPSSLPVPSTPPHRTGLLDEAFSSPESSPSSMSSSSSSSSSTSSLRRQKSKFSFQESPHSNFVTATFEMPDGLTKSDIHVSYTTSYGAERVTVSWQNSTITEFIEAGKLVRERKERKYARTLPLPTGTKFDQVRASMQDGLLAITYPRSPLKPMENVKTLPIA